MSSSSDPCCITCKKPQSQLPNPLKYCAKCQTGSYCSRKCQTDDWKVHKKTCGKVTPVRPPAPAASGSGFGGAAAPNRAANRAANRADSNAAARFSAGGRGGAMRLPTRREYIASQNSHNPDFDSDVRPAHITQIFRLVNGDIGVDARRREAAANAAFERGYANTKDQLVGGSSSSFVRGGTVIDKLHTILDAKAWLVDLDEFACYEVIIDAYRLRLIEEYWIVTPETRRDFNLIKDFGEFLDKAHEERILPEWWLEGGEGRDMICIRLAMKKDGSATIWQCLGDADMVEKYEYQGVVGQLRNLAAKIYGYTVVPKSREARLKHRGLWFIEDNDWRVDVNMYFETICSSY